MNSLGIVMRSCLREAEESNGRKWGRRAAIGGALGVGAVGAGALYNTGKLNAKHRTLAALSGSVEKTMRHPLHTAQQMAASGKSAVMGAPGYMRDLAVRSGAFEPDFAARTGHVAPVPGAVQLSGAGARGLKYAGGAALAGAAGYGAYRAYKRYKAKECAEAAAREAYATVYQQVLMEAEGESSARKWGRRALIAGGALGAAHIGGSAVRNMALLRAHNPAVDWSTLGKGAWAGAKSAVTNPIASMRATRNALSAGWKGDLAGNARRIGQSARVGRNAERMASKNAMNYPQINLGTGHSGVQIGEGIKYIGQG